jgi:GNAT superfamily N-acetyltransferase
VLAFDIRSAVRADLASMLHVEQQAERLFALADLPALLRSCAPRTVYLASIQNGLCWIAQSVNGETIGFIACKRISSFLHILEMDVLPEFGRQGVGSALLTQAYAVATAMGDCEAITLTTFRHLPWNQPFYQKHGFEPVTDIRHIADILRSEMQNGLSNRIGMLMRTKAVYEPTK